MNNRARGGRVLARVFGTAAIAVAAAMAALATSGSAIADPPGDCSPGAMMRMQADIMSQLGAYLATHPDAGNSESPAAAADALQMVAGIRNSQAAMADSCPSLVEGAMPGQ